MYLDKENLFSDKQTVSATANSDKVVNLGAGGIGTSVPPIITVFASGFGGTGTLTVAVETAEDEGFTVGKKTIATYPLDNAALKTGGQVLASGVPVNSSPYMRLAYTVGGTITAGVITAGLTR